METKIVFKKKLYSQKAINLAVGAFSQLAEFVLKSNSRETVVYLKNIDPEVADIIADEFANYVLVKTKNSF